jgi:hypothetical protein
MCRNGRVDRKANWSTLKDLFMEVHHHPKAGKKNFKEYFLEFLMIFLAVTMGFIAESIRENISDREKEKEFMQSIVRDLKVDKNNIDTSIATYNFIDLCTDSLIKMANSGDCFKHTSDFYFYGRMAPRYVSFVADTRTIDEMKGGGWFRVIKNKEVADSIMAYYSALSQINGYEERLSDIVIEYRKIYAQVFDPAITSNMLAGVTKRPEGNPPLRVKDNKLLLDLSAFAQFVYIIRNAIENLEKNSQTKGEALAEFIQKKYHLKDE